MCQVTHLTFTGFLFGIAERSASESSNAASFASSRLIGNNIPQPMRSPFLQTGPRSSPSPCSEVIKIRESSNSEDSGTASIRENNSIAMSRTYENLAVIGMICNRSFAPSGMSFHGVLFVGNSYGDEATFTRFQNF